MRVARSVTSGRVQIETSPDPVPGAGDVVARVLACGVCKTDVLDWYVARKVPAVLGHELAAEVTAVGAGVSGIGPGDRVVVHHHAPCGECRRCQRGRETLCERFRATALDPGGFAERVRIPAALVPELLPCPGLDPVAATFVEPLACVLRSQDRAGLQAGDTLLVAGAGANGLLQVAAARARGVEAVWVREPQESRLARAVAWGAERHGNEAVDVAIVCTPAGAAIGDAARALAPGGTLCLYAPPQPGAPLPVDGGDVFLREIAVTASYSAAAADMRAALALIASGRIDPLPLVSHRLGLDETALAFDLARRGEALKAVVLP